MGTKREQYRQPEERTLADLMVGSRVILQHLVGPDPDPDKPDEEVRGHLQAVTGAYWLHAISAQGLELSRSLSGEGAEIFLVPWASVLVLDGRPRGDLEHEAQETLGTDQQQLLDRLSDPQQEDRTVGLDTRRYLIYNPNDEEVRKGLDGLPREHLYS